MRTLISPLPKNPSKLKTCARTLPSAEGRGVFPIFQKDMAHRKKTDIKKLTKTTAIARKLIEKKGKKCCKDRNFEY